MGRWLRFGMLVSLCSALLVSGARCYDAAPQVDAAQQEVSRFVVRARADQSAADVAAGARAALGGDTRVEPLFAGLGAVDLPEAMRRSYRVSISRVDGNAWDVAARVREAGGFELVQPDLNDSAQPEVDAATGLDCTSDSGVPGKNDPAWALRDLDVPGAWEIELAPGGRRFGEGARVCHPDTGWAEHVDLDADRIDLAAARDILDGDADARDPLDYEFPLASRGHGTATGSVIMSDGGVADGTGTTGPGSVTGVAPRATLVPMRTVKSVVQAFDSDVARAVVASVAAGCDVISMSLGGRMFFGLREAVELATQRGLIVVAAAGNCVENVVAPAVYPHAIAVAATNSEKAPWSGSSHGPAVAIAAPGADVLRALRRAPNEATDLVEPSNGTSYATAEVAGAAALWLAHHGRAAIEASRRPGENVQDVFRRALAAAAEPPDTAWDSHEYGPGLLNVATLLSAPLGGPAPPGAPAEVESDAIALLARTLDVPRAELERDLERRFGAAIREPSVQERVLPELSYLALRQPAALHAFLASAGGGLGAPAAAPLVLSDQVRSQVVTSEGNP